MVLVRWEALISVYYSPIVHNPGVGFKLKIKFVVKKPITWHLGGIRTLWKRHLTPAVLISQHNYFLCTCLLLSIKDSPYCWCFPRSIKDLHNHDTCLNAKSRTHFWVLEGNLVEYKCTIWLNRGTYPHILMLNSYFGSHFSQDLVQSHTHWPQTSKVILLD